MIKNHARSLIFVILLSFLFGCSRNTTSGAFGAGSADTTILQTETSKAAAPTITDCQVSARFVLELPDIPEDLPTQAVTEILEQSAGSEATWKRGNGSAASAYQPFFTVALSQIKPVCYTPENTLVCSLQLNSNEVMLLTIDRSDLSKPIEFYLPDDWDWTSENSTLSFNGYWDETLAEVCQDVMALHLNGTGYETLGSEIDLHDKETNTYCVDVEFDKIKGLSYHIPVISGFASDHYLTAFCLPSRSVLISKFTDTPYRTQGRTH